MSTRWFWYVITAALYCLVLTVLQITRRLNELEHVVCLNARDVDVDVLWNHIDTRTRNVHEVINIVAKRVDNHIDQLDECMAFMERSERKREFVVDCDIRVLSRVQGILARCQGLRWYMPYFNKLCLFDESCEEVFGESGDEGSGLDMELE